MTIAASILAGLIGAVSAGGAPAAEFGKAHAVGCYANYVPLLNRDGAQIDRLAPGEEKDVLTEESVFWSARVGAFSENEEDAELDRQLAGAQRALALARTVLTTGPQDAQSDMTGALAQCRTDRSAIEAETSEPAEPTDG
ncbi:MAG: hypothetical protein ABL308_11585 [Oceanicaulis sp.]